MSHQGRLKACIIINYAVMSLGGFANSLWQACISYRKSLPLYYGKDMIIEMQRSQLEASNVTIRQMNSTIDNLQQTISDLRKTVANLESLLKERVITETLTK